MSFVLAKEAEATGFVRLFWSLVERLAPRLISAGASLLVARRVPPDGMGVYAWGVVALTLVLCVTDSAISQLAVAHVRSTRGSAFLRDYVQRGTPAATVGIGLAIGLIVVLAPSDLHGFALQLLPLVLVPAACAVRVIPMALLQADHQWRRLARFQMLAVSCSVLPFALMMSLGFGVLATSIQTLAAESVFSLLVALVARGVAVGPSREGPDDDYSGELREFRHLAIYSLLGWSQGQADRLLVGIMAGPSRLGVYSLGWSAARAVGDGLSLSTANVVRASVITTGGVGERNRIGSDSDAVLRKAVVGAVLLAIATCVAAGPILRPILGPSWDPAIQIIPILSLTTIATTVAWSLTVVLVTIGRARRAAPIKAVGVAMCIPIAILARSDLAAASWLAVAREVAVMIAMSAACGKMVPVRSVAIAVGSVAVLAFLLVGGILG